MCAPAKAAYTINGSLRKWFIWNIASVAFISDCFKKSKKETKQNKTE
jgi:hypothetical protein